MKEAFFFSSSNRRHQPPRPPPAPQLHRRRAPPLAPPPQPPARRLQIPPPGDARALHRRFPTALRRTLVVEADGGQHSDDADATAHRVAHLARPSRDPLLEQRHPGQHRRRARGDPDGARRTKRTLTPTLSRKNGRGLKRRARLPPLPSLRERVGVRAFFSLLTRTHDPPHLHPHHHRAPRAHRRARPRQQCGVGAVDPGGRARPIGTASPTPEHQARYLWVVVRHEIDYLRAAVEGETRHRPHLGRRGAQGRALRPPHGIRRRGRQGQGPRASPSGRSSTRPAAARSASRPRSSRPFMG